MSVRTMETQDHLQGVIHDLQMRKLEMGSQIVALHAEIKQLKDANADQQDVIRDRDAALDLQQHRFSHAPLGTHVVAWLRSRW